MATTPERRRHPRYRLDLPVTLMMASEPGVTFEATMQDLSAGGCLFRASLPRDDFGAVSLSFKRQMHAPMVSGLVVRRDRRESFAVSFNDPGADLTKLVSALGALTPALRGDFVLGFLDPAVEVY